MRPRILLTGKNGQVGADLSRLLPAIADVTAFDRAQLDLADLDGLRRKVREVRPHLILNAAAYTKVDLAEQEYAAAFAANAEAPAALAAEAKNIGAAVVHYSTDYVFDGSKRSPYTETDRTNAASVYGKSKLAGEEAIRTSGVPHLILRTAWVYAPRGRNFLLTILRLSTQREELKIVRDQIGAPTLSREIATGTVRILSALGGSGFSPDAFAAIGGTYHMTAGGEVSWYEFAQAILAESAAATQPLPWLTAATGGQPRITRVVTPISTEEYPTPARRPAYSVLSNARLLETFGFQLPGWREQLRSLFREDSEGQAGA
jgi:dTDP-4-dehydrorhamnose reductase